MSTQIQAGDGTRTLTAQDWGTLPRATSHAEFRWLQRGNDRLRSVVEAWLEGYPVGQVTRGGQSRLHPPSRTLIVAVDGVIKTVLNAEYTSYTADHLLICDSCSLEFQPHGGNRGCPWCGTDHPKVTQ